ncbi:hypothetical protein, conserved [Thermococcus onnurineus NA1]|uniref:Uncharacterized protein n=1 Tax=Thermococcus onnurineus (strain NA1) TaxID=523850 RepID=B6YWL3_THEON|nr:MULTISPECIES: hypothetical protein [Thermococcus]ACJ16476.1 hypothetical protein, conserved [Thermococcus onnurineus NA1]NJE47734.1 hypothetical protein [Thermococcus sp. GR7]NJE78706.1 hypothetical protein [Thermococcus sp. GR4]NJF22410.1 hypothetical protein [Thermococcus sp. GR5]
MVVKVKFKGKAFGNIVRIEFEILTIGELKIDDLRDFDVDSIKIELKPTSSGIKVIGIWEGTVDEAGEGIKKALEESYKLRERILNRIKSKTEAIRSTMRQLGFKEEVEGYGSVIKFIKKVGSYEIVVVASTTDDMVRVEVYGNDKKIISPEIESIFEDVEVEELEIYDFEDTKEERLVINLEIPKNEEKPERKIVEAIRMIENMLMA